MRNNRRIKMIAWIMAAVMLLCTMPVAAMAGIKLDNVIPQDFMMDNQADVSYTIEGNVLHLIVSKKENITFSDTMYYKLPLEVESASSGQSSTYSVSWDASQDGMMVFHVSNATNKEYLNLEIDVTLASDTYDLYNIVKIGNTYYRLAKTKIKSLVGSAKAILDIRKTRPTSNVLTEDEYIVEDYDFSNVEITLNGKTYIYSSEDTVQDPDNLQPYYTVKFTAVTAIENKIGAQTNGKSNWIVDESQRYDDNNKTTGYHRDFEITLHEAPSVQPLYNFLHFDGDSHYYRLKITTVIANSLTSYKNNDHPNADQYHAEQYNFTNLVLTHDGKEYSYSATELDGLHENYYTVSFEGLVIKDRIHESKNGIDGPKWLINADGFLDGSEADYAGITTNNTKGFHIDYKVTFHDANAVFHNVELHNGENVETLRLPENKEVELPLDGEIIGWSTAADGNGEIYNAENPLTLTGETILYAVYAEAAEPTIIYHSSLEGVEKVFVGTEITLSATIVGYEEPYTLQWEYEDPKNPGVRHDIEGETSISYTFDLDTTNCTYTYFIKVIPVE